MMAALDLCGEEGRTYQCEVCLRFVPRCFGAHDEFPEACDDCAAAFLEVLTCP